MLMVAFSASVGGISTPIGTPTNLIGIGLIKKLTGMDINFFQWMTIGMPLCAVMYGVLFVLLYRLHREKDAGKHGHLTCTITTIPPERTNVPWRVDSGTDKYVDRLWSRCRFVDYARIACYCPWKRTHFVQARQ